MIQTYITGWIDSLQLKGVQVKNVKKQKEGHYIVTIYGGLNGYASWDFYIRQIKTIIDSLQRSWVISLNNDCLDDVWTLQLGLQMKDIKKL